MMALVVTGLAMLVLLGYLSFRIAKIEPASFAALCFFFPPLAVRPLVENWDNGRNDIRWPCFTAWGACILFAVVALDAGFQVQDPVPVQNQSSVAAQQDQTRQEPTAVDLEKLLDRALEELPSQDEIADLAPAPAILRVPEHFTAFEASALRQLVQMDQPADPARLAALVVHESVVDESAGQWWITLDWVGQGQLSQAGLPYLAEKTWLADARARGAGDGAVERLIGMPMLPEYYESEHTAAWVYAYMGSEGSHHLDCHAAKLGKSGLVHLVIREMPPQLEELCLRSVRLIASRIEFTRGQWWEDPGIFADTLDETLADFVLASAD